MKKNNYVYLILFFLLLSCGNGIFLDQEAPGSSTSVHVTNSCNFDSTTCTHWFDATKFNTFHVNGTCNSTISGDGDTVRCWTNEGSLSSDDITRSGGFTGTYQTAEINSNDSNFIDGVSNQASFFNNYKPVDIGTWFFVLRVSSVSGGGRFIMANGDAGVDETGVSMNNSGFLEFFHGGQTFAYNSQNLIGQNILISVVFNGTSFLAYLNGQLVGSQILGTTYQGQAFSLAARYGSGGVTNGASTYFGELLIYDKSLSDQERKAIEGHLKTKWSL